MRVNASVFAYILAVPLLACVVSATLQWKYSSKWNKNVFDQIAKMSADQAGGMAGRDLSIDAVCAQSDDGFCEMYEFGVSFGWWAIATGLLGLVVLGAIALSGYVSRTHRVFLLVVFAPGLYLTVAALMLLILAHAALVIVSIYLLESVIGESNSIHGNLMFYIGLGALLGVMAMARSCLAALKKARMVVVGRRISWDANPRLLELTTRLAARIHTSLPQNVVVGLDPTFFVTQANVLCIDGELVGRTLYLSLPLCRVVSEDELAAILGHELGHFKGADTAFSMRFYPIYSGARQSIGKMQTIASRGVEAVALLPAISILNFFLQAFELAEKRLSREREFAADAEGRYAVGAKPLATALIRIHAFAGLWPSVREQMRLAMNDGMQLVNASEAFELLVSQHHGEVDSSTLDEQEIEHPTDTHPPLEARLQALGFALPVLAGQLFGSEAARPLDPAVQLITEPEAMERELTDLQHALMAEAG